LTERFNNDSDINLVVDFQDVNLYSYADNYFDLKLSLEDLLRRDVDLLEDKAIHNPYLRKLIEQTKRLIYG